jgi:hypothetical protein
MFHDPAASILELLGGASPVARHLGVKTHTALRWRYDPAKGTGGVIPFKYHDQIIAFAAAQGIELPRGVFADPVLARDLLRRRRESAASAAA